MLSFMRLVIDKLYPSGAPYSPVPEGNLYNFRNGVADCLEYIRESIKDLAFIRNPKKTPYLSDLEREYGIKTDSKLSESERIKTLEANIYRAKTTGNVDDLQILLDKAGFDLFVYQNSPAVDPTIFLDQKFQMVAGGENAYAGHIPAGGGASDAFAGRIGGELLVNGVSYNQTPAYYGAGTVYAGNDTAKAGYFESINLEEIKNTVPTDSNSWPFIFFVGGPATFNENGSLKTLEQGFVSSEMEATLKTLILKFKPLHSWCGLAVTFT